MVDYWTTQVGRIHDCLTIDCVSYSSIDEGSAVKIYGTTTADQITVQKGAAIGDSVGIALKAASGTGETIPVLFFGVFKCIRKDGTTAINQQAFVFNSLTATSGMTQITATAGVTYDTMALFGGDSYVLGLALQDAAANLDNILVLVGKCI